ncbi:Hsp20/alpha crystallin family protein [Alkalicoccus daliensis]|uniref:HSP20 family protein n=1 Tax=Alkalicoccus daliensis TaxID=745820 RepID=A0A1H0EBL4_9BACI|nr:Hsp20/alpha crystallin family protein [Alkalicoccus daliensis]SDN79708.1 HSP20 family protein [Alkalicoccus daliensis]
MADLQPRKRNRELFPDFTSPFGSLFNEGFSAPFENFNKLKIDIRDEGDRYFVEAELPGFKKEDIDVEYKEPQLTIRAKREQKEESDGKSYVYQERSYGEFVRTFQMRNVKDEDIEAIFEDGVLQLEVPKDDTGRADGRKIDIH